MNFLPGSRVAQKISTLALAHHADDQVELFFLRLLRGAGGAGLAGMKRRSPSPAGKKITLIRPLLVFFKAEILEFARQNGILFREDASNRSHHFLRNRIRNELLPLLKKDYQPGVAGNVLRLMEITGAEAELAADAARQWRKRNGIGKPGRAGPVEQESENPQGGEGWWAILQGCPRRFNGKLCSNN